MCATCRELVASLRRALVDAAKASAEASAVDYDAAGAGFATKAQASRAWAAAPRG